MISIIEQLGTEEIPRLRIGIAQEGERKKSLAGYVLANFAPEERAALPEIFEQCCDALELVLGRDFERAMAKFNKRVAPKADSASIIEANKSR